MTANTAIVHEWIDAYAGSEQVFEALAHAFPEADLYALTRKKEVSLDLGERVVATTFLDRELFRDRRSLTLPLMPVAWRALRPKSCYGLVISSHHAFASSNRLVSDGGTHLGYVYSPARYLWTPEIDRRGARRFMAPARAALKAVDRRAATALDSIAAISTVVAQRIDTHWSRDAVVIPPPVRVEFFSSQMDSPSPRQSPYILGVGRWIPYKNLELVINVGSALGVAVVIAGSGPLKRSILDAAEGASVPVEVVERPSDEVLRSLYQGASALIFPTVEDFGLVPVEAQAAGTPVVAPRDGGTLDTVLDGRTGILTTTLCVEELAQATVLAMELDRRECTRHAAGFSRGAFVARFKEWVTAVA